MSAVIDSDGTVSQLDGRAEQDENLTEADLEDRGKLARLLVRILRELATLRRRWMPRHTDFKDIGTDGSGTTKIQLRHDFNGAVAYWPIRCANFGAGGPGLEHHADTDANTLVLVAYGVGTVTVRVEEMGA